MWPTRTSSGAAPTGPRRCPRPQSRGACRRAVTAYPSPEARGLGGPAPALGVGDPETARTALLSEDAMLFLERVHDVTRLLVDPARDGHDEELKHLGKRRHTGRAEQRLSAVTNVATRRASSVESARRTASIGFLDSTGRWSRILRSLWTWHRWMSAASPKAARVALARSLSHPQGATHSGGVPRAEAVTIKAWRLIEPEQFTFGWQTIGEAYGRLCRLRVEAEAVAQITTGVGQLCTLGSSIS